MNPPAGSLHPFDWHRLLFGQQTPWWVLLEVALRIGLIYGMLMVAMRLLGKRVASQMSLTEIAVIVTLGAAVGVPMQDPDKGMLAPLVILTAAIVFQRGLSWWAFRNRRVELLSQGDVCTLVADGRLLLSQMEANTLSRERLFSMLRAAGFQHLGQLRRVYMESSGDLSIIARKESRPGLSILPSDDEEIRHVTEACDGQSACMSCGNVRHGGTPSAEACEKCESTHWSQAVVAAEA